MVLGEFCYCPEVQHKGTDLMHRSCTSSLHEREFHSKSKIILSDSHGWYLFYILLPIYADFSLMSMTLFITMWKGGSAVQIWGDFEGEGKERWSSAVSAMNLFHGLFPVQVRSLMDFCCSSISLLWIMCKILWGLLFHMGKAKPIDFIKNVLKINSYWKIWNIFSFLRKHF